MLELLSDFKKPSKQVFSCEICEILRNCNVIKSVAENQPRDLYSFLNHKLGQYILNKAEGFAFAFGFASRKALFGKAGLLLVNFTLVGRLGANY